MARNVGDVIGSWAFLIGVVLALVFGAIGSMSTTITITLVVIGLVVGLLNIADKEVHAFLLSGAVLVIVAAQGGSVMTGVPYVNGILQAMLAIFVPATIIVAIKNVFSLAKSR